MKNQQPKETSAARVNPAVVDDRPRVINEEAIFPKPDYLEAGYESWPRPTELELANLAARLARTEKTDPKQLVKEAWGVYRESCRRLQADHLEVAKLLEKREAQNDERLLEESGGLPQPSKFPVTFQEMELLLLPKLRGRTGERASVFREYALTQILEQSFTFKGGFRVPTYWDLQPDALKELRAEYSELVATRFGSWRGKAYDAGAYARFAGPFLKWYERWLVYRSSHLKSANARKGWAKRQAEKTDKTGARPKEDELREIVKEAAERKKFGDGGLDRSRGQKNRKPQEKNSK